jgi:hypothetical protein
MYLRSLAIAAALVVVLSGTTALAQCGCGAVPYAPAPYYAAYYAPPMPYAAYYPAPAPYAAYYAPGPAPCATCAALVPYPYGWAGWSIYGTPRVYVVGQPVRNVVRAVFP